MAGASHTGRCPVPVVRLEGDEIVMSVRHISKAGATLAIFTPLLPSENGGKHRRVQG